MKTSYQSISLLVSSQCVSTITVKIIFVITALSSSFPYITEKLMLFVHTKQSHNKS